MTIPSAITLPTNTPALSATNSLARTTAKLNQSFERLSSGLRINRPGDDPAGVFVADQLKADALVAGTAIRNAGDAISLTAIADAALSGLSGLLSRMAELAEQSANGTFGNSQRSALANEFLALGSEVQRIAKVTTFNGIALLSNSQSVTIQIGLDSSANSRVSVGTLTATLDALGLASSGSDKLSYSIITTSDVGSEDASRNALNAVKAAIGNLNVTRGTLGAAESRLGAAVDFLSSIREQFIAAESRIRDADIAQETAELVKLQVLQQAQTSVLAQANQQVTIALSLLG